MDQSFDRRKFLRIAGASLGFGALYRVAPLAATPAGRRLQSLLGKKNGEPVSPFSFVQLSDTHVGFQGPPNPLGTQAFERAVERINVLSPRPDLVLFTGDLTHDSEKPAEHADRMHLFEKIAAGLKVSMVKAVPGEHDAGLDGGALFRDAFGETSYSFDHRGVHFIALDNVSRGKPVVGTEQLAWLKKDLALFDLRSDREWVHDRRRPGLESARSLRERHRPLRPHPPRAHPQRGARRPLRGALAHLRVSRPASAATKQPLAFDPGKPFANLGLRVVREGSGPSAPRPVIEEVELTLQERSGLVGIQQFLKAGEES